MLETIFFTPVYTQTGNWPPKIDDLSLTVDRVLGYLMPIGILLCVVMIIYGGYMWIVSGGDPSRKQVAQGTLTWAIIGLVFLFLIRMILLFIMDWIS